MRGSRLVTTDRVVCLAAPGSAGVVDRLADAMADHDAVLTVRAVGEALDGVDLPPGRTLGITVGGDGTFLSGVRAFAPRSVPFFGVNTGTLGFLAGTPSADLEPALAEILGGEATVTSRQRYRVTGPGLDATGINEVTFELPMPEDPVGRKVCRLDVAAGGESLGQYEGTGLAVTAPTGSTAMALSAGAPLQQPAGNDTLQVVPLHTNRLGLAPVVLDADRDVRIRTASPIRVTVDGGRPQRRAADGDVFTVTGASEPAYLVRTSHHTPFFGTLAAKLGFGGRSADGTQSPPSRGGTHSADATPSEVSPDVTARRVAREAVCAAGEATAAQFRRHATGGARPAVPTDGRGEHAPGSTATEARRRSAEVIAAVVSRRFPEHGLRMPDATVRQRGGAHAWFAAPLSGLDNFAHRNPQYAVALGLIGADGPVTGAVALPAFDEVFTEDNGSVRRSAAGIDSSAFPGDSHERAERAGIAVEPTTVDSLAECTILTDAKPDGPLLGPFSGADCDQRRPGSAALALASVAAGRADACLLADATPATVGGGVCLLRAAGGRITGIDGEPYCLRSDATERASFVASNGPLHEALLTRLAG